MAKVALCDYIDLGTQGTISKVSYIIAKDKDFTDIVDQTLEDTKFIREWYSPLPKGDGTFYNDLDELWLKVKIWVGDPLVGTPIESDWFIVGPKSQLKQDYVITEEGKDDIYTDTDELELLYGEGDIEYVNQE